MGGPGRVWSKWQSVVSAARVVDIAADEVVFGKVTHTMRELIQQDNHRLAHFTQHIEIAFMFGCVVPRIMQSLPDLLIATIQDSILTTAGDTQSVWQVMSSSRATIGEAK